MFNSWPGLTSELDALKIYLKNIFRTFGVLFPYTLFFCGLHFFLFLLLEKFSFKTQLYVLLGLGFLWLLNYPLVSYLGFLVLIEKKRLNIFDGIQDMFNRIFQNILLILVVVVLSLFGMLLYRVSESMFTLTALTRFIAHLEWLTRFPGVYDIVVTLINMSYLFNKYVVSVALLLSLFYGSIVIARLYFSVLFINFPGITVFSAIKKSFNLSGHYLSKILTFLLMVIAIYVVSFIYGMDLIFMLPLCKGDCGVYGSWGRYMDGLSIMGILPLVLGVLPVLYQLHLVLQITFLELLTKAEPHKGSSSKN